MRYMYDSKQQKLIIRRAFKPEKYTSGQWFIIESNGGYYSLISENSQKLKIFDRISALFTIEDDNLSVGPHVLFKKCFRRIKKYEATVKELTSLKVKYQENVARWRSDVRLFGA